MLKHSDNPPMGTPEPVFRERSTTRWWVAHTKSRHEKSLARVLNQWDQAYFLPMVEKVHVARNRKVKALIPLFPGYIFFAGDDSDCYRLMTTNRVAQILYVEDQDQLLGDLVQLRNALEVGAGERLNPHPFLQHGTNVRITSGVFRGLEGVVQRYKQGTQLVVLQVEALGQAVALEVDAGMVECVEEADGVEG